jgi:hypothetical protein
MKKNENYNGLENWETWVVSLRLNLMEIQSFYIFESSEDLKEFWEEFYFKNREELESISLNRVNYNEIFNSLFDSEVA